MDEIESMFRRVIREEIAIAFRIEDDEGAGSTEAREVKGAKKPKSSKREGLARLPLSPMEAAIVELVGSGSWRVRDIQDELPEYNRTAVANAVGRLTGRGILSRPRRGVYALAWGRA